MTSADFENVDLKLVFESNNYFASALCTDAVCEEKLGEWEGIGKSIFGIGVNKEYAAACIKQKCYKKKKTLQELRNLPYTSVLEN